MASSTNSSMKLGYAEYACIPDDGRRHEIIDGEHFVNPSPNPYHQTVSKRLQYQLYTQIELQGKGFVFNAPLDVQLTDHDIVQPDLFFFSLAKKTIITPTRIVGIPDLVVEILSPSSVSYDEKLKRQLYQRTGVAEYWIVDPFEPSLDQFVLRDGQYQLQSASDEVRPTTIEGVIVRLIDVW